MSEQVKRSALKHFLDTTPKATPTYSMISTGVSDLSVGMNPETDTQQWISEDSASTFLKSYGITIDTKQIAFKGDPVYDFVDELGFRQAVLSEAETTLVEARVYMASNDAGPYPAKKWKVNIAVSNYGGPGSDALGIEYAINVMGDPEYGTFDLDTLTFTKE